MIEEIASFPSGEHDDYVDSTSMALLRFRKGGYIQTTMDEPEDEYTAKELWQYKLHANKTAYY